MRVGRLWREPIRRDGMVDGNDARSHFSFSIFHSLHGDADARAHEGAARDQAARGGSEERKGRLEERLQHLEPVDVELHVFHLLSW